MFTVTPTTPRRNGSTITTSAAARPMAMHPIRVSRFTSRLLEEVGHAGSKALAVEFRASMRADRRRTDAPRHDEAMCHARRSRPSCSSLEVELHPELDDLV